MYTLYLYTVYQMLTGDYYLILTYVEVNQIIYGL